MTDVGFGPILQKNLDVVKDLLRKDYDWLHLNIGKERIGKSSLGISMCKYVDPSFSLRQLWFTDYQFHNGIRKSHKYEAGDLDEGSEVLFARNAMTRGNKKMIQSFTQMGSKNLFINVNIPDIMLLEKYIRLHRVSSCTRVLKRGIYAFYSAKRVKEIYIDSKTKKVKWPEANFIERFSKYPNNAFWKAYLRKKEGFQNTIKENPKAIRMEEKIENILRNTVSRRDAAKTLHVTEVTLWKWERDNRHNPLKAKLHVVKTTKGVRYPYALLKRLSQKMYGATLNSDILIKDSEEKSVVA